MKKLLVFLMISAVLFCSACAGSEQPAVQPGAEDAALEPSPTPEPTPTPEPEPETVGAELLYVRTGAVITTIPRGERLEVTDDLGGLCRVSWGEYTGLAEKCLLRPASAEPYEPWDAYAKSGAKLYDNYRLTGEGTALTLNAQVHIVDAYGDCLVAEYDGKTGYILADSVSQYMTQTWWGGDSGGGSGGGGGGADGGDISLSAAHVDPNGSVLPDMAPFSGGGSIMFLADIDTPDGEELYSGEAFVLVDNAELYLRFFEPGDELRITEYDDKFCTVYCEKQTALIPRQLVRLESDETYEPWDGFAQYNSEAHSSYLLNDPAPRRLSLNTSLSVIGELEECYAAVLDGECLFVPKDDVSKTAIVVYYGGGDSGGGGGGGGEWTPPAL